MTNLRSLAEYTLVVPAPGVYSVKADVFPGPPIVTISPNTFGPVKVLPDSFAMSKSASASKLLGL